MAINVGLPPIVDDGLVLCLDPKVTQNYILSQVEVLVVAGGGGGGGWGGGGGGGGVLYSENFPVTPGSAITITVGGGGSPGTNAYTSGGDGGNSSFGTLTAIGGGGGGHFNNNNGRTGGSGGGGGGSATATYGFSSLGGSGIQGQGNSGGRGGGVISGYYLPGGGGGGAGEPGRDVDTFERIGGKGGDGLPFNISGRLRYYGGGGGGHTDGRALGDNSSSLGGKGGGGRGGNYAIPRRGLNGAANTGGGGGGSYGTQAGFECGAGGSGVVIVRYPGPQKATGGDTITQVDGYTIHTFTTVGSSTFTPSTAPVNTGAVTGLQDLSGYFNTATQVGGVTYSTSGEGSLVFDGTNDYVSIPYTSVLAPTSQISFEAFAYLPNWNISGDRRILSKTQGGGYQIGLNEPTFMLDGNIGALVYLGGSYKIVKVARSTLSAGWHHLAFTCDGRYFRMYLDGVNVNTFDNGSTASISYSTNNHFLVGAEPGAGTAVDGAYWNGNISSVKVYNRALTASEIQQNFNALRGRFGI